MGQLLRIAFVSISHFACKVEIQREPRLADHPLIIGEAGKAKHVLDCSAAASAQGVRCGMTVREALGLCPDVVIVTPDPVLYRSKWEATLLALGDLTPEIEDEEMGQAYLNVAGLERHYRDDADLCDHIAAIVRSESGLDASVGLAGSKFVALAAAISASAGETGIVGAGEEASFLAPLSVDLLPVEPAVISRLRLLALERIGDLARLSLPELQSQFGFEGKRIWQLANGVDQEPLRPRRRVESLEAALAFEAPVAGVEVLVAAAKQLLSRLRLPLRGRAVRELTLQAELTTDRGWERRLVFREAVSETDRLAFLLRSTLQNAPPPLAVRGLSLRLSRLAGESGKQLYMGERSRLERQLEEATRHLKARYGYSPIYHCVDVEPWSVIPEERQILVESDA